MAAPVNNNPGCWRVPEVYKHHEQRKVCISRPKYREGRKAKAVKVYTINLESRYLMIQGVPAIGVMTELIQLCALYGAVEEYRPLDEYPAEEFTEVYLVKFQKLTSARAAKRHMDEKSFYGGVLHVCYVPEYETVEDTRLKLQDRRSYVIRAAQKRGIIFYLSHTHTHTHTHTHKHTKQVTLHLFIISLYISIISLCHLHFYLNLNSDHFKRKGRGNTRGQREGSSRRNQTLSSRVTDHRQEAHQATGVRFLPRTTHLEKRKRKMEEAAEHSITISGQNEPLIGPKLPEPSKLDMEDKSLNTTVNLIRNTMKQPLPFSFFLHICHSCFRSSKKQHSSPRPSHYHHHG
uniref:RNA-binding protein 48 n=1 Tax=Amphilophus citrinellus TaxID=61819 RepID=A0A3Q0SYJ6_AMPCI